MDTSCRGEPGNPAASRDAALSGRLVIFFLFRKEVGGNDEEKRGCASL